VNPADQPTQPVCADRTVLNTTDVLTLSPSVLAQDARHVSARAEESEGPTDVLVVPGAEASLDEPATLDGYEFLMCLERSPLGELWRVRAPNDRTRLAHCLDRDITAQLGRRLRRLHLLRHPALSPVELAQGHAGQVVLLMDAPRRTLADRFRESRQRGEAGIPRVELLRALRPVARTLDQLFGQLGWQHLGLQPSSLWLEEERVLIAGFGLVQMLALPTTGPAAVINPRYAAPDLLQGQERSRCDQYSLALIYAEMATGVHPVDIPGGQRRSGGRVELALLAAAERAVVARALQADPANRFPSCTTFIEALRRAMPPEGLHPPERPGEPSAVLLASRGLRAPTSLDDFVRELLALAAGPAGVRQSKQIRYRLEGGRSLSHRCAVNLFPGAALLKLEGFRQEWQAETVARTRESFVFSVRTSLSFWERLVGRRMGLEIHIHFTPPTRPTQKLAEVSVLIRPFGCGRARAVKMLEETGPLLLESLRTHLQALPEQRGQERLLWNERLRVHPVLAGLRVADGIDCIAKDISARGIGFFLPQPLAASHVYVNHPGRPDLADIAALAKVVRGQRCRDGWYEVGALFTPEELDG
jgi:hypothetical protein